VSRTVIIGDIHACYVELAELLELLRVTDDDRVISVGDLVDRGPDPRRVLELFRDRPNSVVLAGNHERKHVRQVFSYAQEITRLQLGAEYDAWVAWMTTLPYSIELEDAIVVHAAAVPGVAIAEQKPEILCGSTAGEQELSRVLDGKDWAMEWSGPKPVAFGHRVLEQPLVRPGLVYGLDTGACHGGHLTALVLPGFELHSVPAHEDYWKRIKREWQAPVLAGKPWTELNWEELDEQLARFTRASEPAAIAYVESLHRWREALEQRMPETHAAIVREAERLQRETPEAELRAVLASHALSGFLFQVLRGKFDLAAFCKQCRTPRKLQLLDEGIGLAPLQVPRL